jgi:hypothetical protein
MLAPSLSRVLGFNFFNSRVLGFNFFNVRSAGCSGSTWWPKHRAAVVAKRPNAVPADLRTEPSEGS